MTSLRARIAAAQSGRKKSLVAVAAIILLLPATAVYWLALQLRRFGYSIGVRQRRRLPGKVISIGNITTGGTGKTPVAIMIARRLKTRGIGFALLSRGYRSKLEDVPTIFNSGQLSTGTRKALGDEVALLTEKLLDSWFGVGKDRYQAGRKLHRQENLKLFLLDDGFQHWQLARDLEIVLVDAANPFGNGLLLPAGSLRETKAALRRADLLLITKADAVSKTELQRLTMMLSRYLPAERILELRTVMASVYDFAGKTALSLPSLQGKRLFAFSGIGSPESFHSLLQANALSVTSSIIYDDHHAYSAADLKYLHRVLSDGLAEMLVTTEKDAVKLPRDSFGAGECLVVEISVVFERGEDIFWGKIGEVIDATV